MIASLMWMVANKMATETKEVSSSSGQRWWEMNNAEVLRATDSRLPRGLTAAEVKQRQTKFGPNEIPSPPGSFPTLSSSHLQHRPPPHKSAQAQNGSGNDEKTYLCVIIRP
jgi:hypothetical protein